MSIFIYIFLIKEKQGFEPWVPRKGYDRLAIYCFRPLSHFSLINKLIFNSLILALVGFEPTTLGL